MHHPQTIHRAHPRNRFARGLTPRHALTLASVALLAGGCRSYESRPLDARAIRDDWLARQPADETARALADRLAAREGDTASPIFDPADGLTLAEGEPVALVFNRELRLARLEADVATAVAEYAGRWEDPALGVDIERIVSGVAEPWVVAGTVGLTIPISGRLSVEKDQAFVKRDASLRRVAAEEWATRAALRALWIEWSAQALRARLAAEYAEQVRTVDDLALRQEQAGLLSRIESRLFRVERAEADVERIQAAAHARELELQLRDVLGLAPNAPVELVETVMFESRWSISDWTLDAATTHNTELAVARAEYEVAEQSLRLQVRKQYPDLTIGPGYGSDQGDERVLLAVRLPIPLWNGNRQAIAEAEAEREAARARYTNAYERLGSRLALARSRYDAARATRESIETDVLPLADEQDAEVRNVAELGRVDPLLLLQTMKSRHDAKLRLVSARAAESTGAIRLDELIGPPSPLVVPTHPDPPTTESSSDAAGGRP